jgi:hypothetical protein
MNYITCILPIKEGFGSRFQSILSCYLLSKLKGLKFVYTDIKDFEHMTWESYSSQEMWDKMVNMYISTIFLPRNDLLLYEELPSNTNKVDLPTTEFNFNNYENTLFLSGNVPKMKQFLDREINNNLNIMEELKSNYFKNINIQTYYDKNKINVALHVRRYTKTDGCSCPSRQFYEKGNIYDNYYYNMICNIKDIFKNIPLEFHIFTQIDSDEMDFFKHYLDLEDEYSKIIIHTGTNIFSDIHHMIIADILIMSKSSFSIVANYYSTGISIIRGTFQHTTVKNTIYNNMDGNLNESQTLFLKDFISKNKLFNS